MFIDFEAIKKDYRITDIVRKLNGTIDRTSKCNCLIIGHNDKTPSMHIYTNTDSFYCFTCGVGGSIIDLVMKATNLDKTEACRFITDYNFSKYCKDTYTTTYSRNKSIKNDSYIKTHDSTKSNVIKQTDSNNKEHKEVKNFHKVYTSLLQNEYTEYTTYLKGRSITIAPLEYIECKVVKDSKAIESKLINKYGKDLLVEAGLYSKNNNFLFKNDYLLIPYFDKHNQIHTIKARSTKEKRFANCNNRTLILYGINRLYNDCTLSVNDRLTRINHKDIDTVYICESEIDALSILQYGKIAVACGGAKNWNDSYTKELLKIDNVIIATDNDKVGNEAITDIATSFLKYRKTTYFIDRKEFLNCKDVNEVLVNQ